MRPAGRNALVGRQPCTDRASRIPSPVPGLAGQRLSDQPMVAERVGHPSLAWPVSPIRDWRDLDGALLDGLVSDRVGIGDQ
jgi:hypothetical protein